MVGAGVVADTGFESDWLVPSPLLHPMAANADNDARTITINRSLVSGMKLLLPRQLHSSIISCAGVNRALPSLPDPGLSHRLKQSLQVEHLAPIYQPPLC
jgi:hypothetical protein